MRRFAVSLVCVLAGVQGVAARVAPVPAVRPSQGTCAISGRVTLDGRPVPAVTVRLLLGRGESAVTDEDGVYVIRNLAPASYRVRPVLAGFTVDGEQTYATVTLSNGETIRGIDFRLVPAATISGHVLDAQKQPLVGAAVFIERLDASNTTIEKRGLPFLVGNGGEFSFSDVQAGTYRVSAQVAPGDQPVRTYYYPGTTSSGGARPVQVSAGETVAGIDVLCGLPEHGFVATGRVVDAASGNPMPDVRLVCGAMAGDAERAAVPARFQTDSNGVFTITGLRSASYWLAVLNQRTAALYSRPQYFDVAGSDVRGLEIPMMRGRSIGGRVRFEGEPAALGAMAEADRFVVAFWPKTGETGAFPERVRSSLIKEATVGKDGVFLIEGAPPGVGSLSLHRADSFQPPGDYAVRIERGGIDVSRELEVKGDINDVVITVRGGHAAVHGYVQASNSPLPVRQLEVLISMTNPGGSLLRRIPLNPDGRFVAEGLPPGDYYLIVVIHLPPNLERGIGTRQVRLGADDIVSVDFTVTIPRGQV